MLAVLINCRTGLSTSAFRSGTRKCKHPAHPRAHNFECLCFEDRKLPLPWMNCRKTMLHCRTFTGCIYTSSLRGPSRRFCSARLSRLKLGLTFINISGLILSVSLNVAIKESLGAERGHCCELVVRRCSPNCNSSNQTEWRYNRPTYHSTTCMCLLA